MADDGKLTFFRDYSPTETPAVMHAGEYMAVHRRGDSVALGWAKIPESDGGPAEHEHARSDDALDVHHA